jgi:hypothetical protein
MMATQDGITYKARAVGLICERIWRCKVDDRNDFPYFKLVDHEPRGTGQSRLAILRVWAAQLWLASCRHSGAGSTPPGINEPGLCGGAYAVERAGGGHPARDPLDRSGADAALLGYCEHAFVGPQ